MRTILILSIAGLCTAANSADNGAVAGAPKPRTPSPERLEEVSLVGGQTGYGSIQGELGQTAPSVQRMNGSSIEPKRNLRSCCTPKCCCKATCCLVVAGAAGGAIYGGCVASTFCMDVLFGMVTCKWFPGA